MQKKMDKTSKQLLQKQLTKKELRNHYLQQRVTSCKNTGTITMRSSNDYDRKREKTRLRHDIRSYF